MTEEQLLSLTPAGYGNKKVFEKRLKEGYTEAAYGSGEWVGEYRIVRIWALFKPDGSIATYEHPKADQAGGMRHGEPFEAEYSAYGFEKYKEAWRITLGERVNLAELLERWPVSQTNAD